MSEVSRHDLEAYLDEGLPPGEMARIEGALRGSEGLRRMLSSIHARRDAGLHSVGEIWRRERITCATRGQLGAFLMDALDAAEMRYLEFHLTVVGCRCCQANLADLRNRQAETKEASTQRRRRYYESSAGFLGKRR